MYHRCFVALSCTAMFSVFLILTSCQSSSDALPQDWQRAPAADVAPVQWQWAPAWSGQAGTAEASADSEVQRDGMPTTRVNQTARAEWALQPSGRADGQPAALSIQEGDLIEVSAWFRNDSTGRVSVTWSDASTGDTAIPRIWGSEFHTTFGQGLTYTTQQWTESRARYVIPPGVTAVLPRAVGAGRGSVWVDGLTIRRIGNVSQVRSSTTRAPSDGGRGGGAGGAAVGGAAGGAAAQTTRPAGAQQQAAQQQSPGGQAGAYGGGRAILNAAWPNDVVRDVTGDWIKGWESRGSFFAVICDVPGVDYADRIMAMDLQLLPVKARFVDTTMCIHWQLRGYAQHRAVPRDRAGDVHGRRWYDCPRQGRMDQRRAGDGPAVTAARSGSRCRRARVRRLFLDLLGTMQLLPFYDERPSASCGASRFACTSISGAP